MKALLVILYTIARIISECDLTDGNIMSLYTTKDCTDCVDQMEIFDNLSNEYDNIIFRDVNCNTCNCDDDIALPRIILTKDREKVDEETGKKTQTELEAFLYKNGFTKERKELQSDAGKIREMKLSDFSNLLVKPWIVLFYQSENEMVLSILKDLAKMYAGRINIGKISEQEITGHERTFGIYKYPTAVAFYDGLSYRFEDIMTHENLLHFAETLDHPVLPEITYNEFIAIANSKNDSTTDFIVFYKDKNLAISYFRKLSQMYRFISRFYISSDEQLIKHASVSFESKKKNVTNDEVVVLCAYKNNQFHQLKLTANNFEFVNNWIFHTHHPILTKITHKNFSRIFQGIKPVILLITQGDTFNSELELFAEKYHDNKASADFVFATLDVNEMFGFVDTLLPGFDVPGLVIHDPVRMTYYADKAKITAKNFGEYTENLINKYQSKQLETYPFAKQKNYTRYYIIIGLLFIGGGLFVIPTQKKVKKH